MRTPPEPARLRLALLLALPLLAGGCSNLEMPGLFASDDEAAAAAEPAADSAGKFVTVTVKNRYGFRIKDPLGRRVTGATCGIWKDRDRDRAGECCWSMRGECACPCPDR